MRWMRLRPEKIGPERRSVCLFLLLMYPLPHLQAAQTTIKEEDLAASAAAAAAAASEAEPQATSLEGLSAPGDTSRAPAAPGNPPEADPGGNFMKTEGGQLYVSVGAIAEGAELPPTEARVRKLGFALEMLQVGDFIGEAWGRHPLLGCYYGFPAYIPTGRVGQGTSVQLPSCAVCGPTPNALHAAPPPISHPQEYYMRNNPTATMALPTELFIILVSCLVGWV